MKDEGTSNERNVLLNSFRMQLVPPVHDLPPWNIAYTQFVIWQKRGEFEMQEFLGRKAQARGAIIDSQSVKTEEKGSSVDMTVGRKSKAEKGIKITNIFQIQAKQ